MEVFAPWWQEWELSAGEKNTQFIIYVSKHAGAHRQHVSGSRGLEQSAFNFVFLGSFPICSLLKTKEKI